MTRAHALELGEQQARAHHGNALEDVRVSVEGRVRDVLDAFEQIAIVTVLVDKARICNQQDKVRIWDASAPVVQSPSECDVDSPKSA